jgi:FkbM family methyltransferase
LCFEPIPEIFKTLEINRPGSQCFQKAIGHENKNVEFLRVTGYAEMLSGVLDYYDSRHMFRINKETHENNGKQDGIIVEMCTLDQFIVPGTKIDFLSIDTEGGEHYILENILKYFSPQVITVEVNYPNEAEKIVNVIKEKYDIVKQLGCDLILKSK